MLSTGRQTAVLNQLNNEYEAVSAVAKQYKANSISSIVVAEENYGEGSSREHAAMEPRFLNVKVILAKSFARIHETNLKKQGMLALTFANKEDYSKIRENDHLDHRIERFFSRGKPLTAVLLHADGTKNHSRLTIRIMIYKLKWFKGRFSPILNLWAIKTPVPDKTKKSSFVKIKNKIMNKITKQRESFSPDQVVDSLY